MFTARYHGTPEYLGNRNFGVPNQEEVGIKGSPNYPLHAKKISTCDLEKITELSKGTPYEKEWMTVMKFLGDPALFCNVPSPDLNDSRCSLSIEEVRQLYVDGFLELLSEDGRILGVVRCYKLLEALKERYRLISWTFTANQDNDPAKSYVALPGLDETRRMVHSGEAGYSVDIQAAFNQYPLLPQVRPYFCIRVPFEGRERWMRLTRMPMGWRPACRIAQCGSNILTRGTKATTKVYIDGICGVGSRDQLVEDLGMIAANASTANLLFKEDLNRPADLVKEQVEFLGLRLCFRTKRVKLVDKTVAKLAALWLRGQRHCWTVRDFISCVAICFYHAAATAGGARIGRHQYVLQRWASYQSTLSHMRSNGVDGLKNKFMLDQEEDLRVPLQTWVEEVLFNEWVDVPQEDNGYDFILVTDASATGWCGILISPQCGKITVASGEWSAEVLPYVQSSAHAEPLAVLASLNNLVNERTEARIHVVGDNKGTIATINKGYSTATSQFVMEVIMSKWPRLTLSASYHEGATLPADAPSRGKPLDVQQLEQFCAKFNIKQTNIRYNNAATDLSDVPWSE